MKQVYELSNEDLEKLHIKIKEERKRRKDIEEKKTIYFKEDTQQLLSTPINDKNCYYVGELRFKVIKRIESLLKNKSLSHNELMILLKYDENFRYIIEWYGFKNHEFPMVTNYKKQKGKPTLYHAIHDIQNLKK